MEVTAIKSLLSSHFEPSVAFLRNSLSELFRRFLIWSVAAGPIPQHVAIIMDGNRRYATMRNMKKSRGHEFGYNSLMHTLRNCYDLGIKYVSVYAFSIENFRRSKEEVDTLMNMMQEKLEALIEKESMVNQYGIRVQILGDLSLLPERVRRAAERAMEFSKGNDRAVLNICAPYTATNEIAKAVEGVVVRAEEVEGKEKEKEIVEEIERGLYTSNCPEPELLIRTSGETRLSNFLLWQTSFSLLYATPVLWPEFSLWQLVRAVVEYQKAYPFLQQRRKKETEGISHEHYD
uniref:Alkyl transferase n=1 Tax=Wollemia nobilis TaxID=56998 RepID=A0A0C9S8B4_9CONI